MGQGAILPWCWSGYGRTSLGLWVCGQSRSHLSKCWGGFNLLVVWYLLPCLFVGEPQLWVPFEMFSLKEAEKQCWGSLCLIEERALAFCIPFLISECRRDTSLVGGCRIWEKVHLQSVCFVVWSVPWLSITWKPFGCYELLSRQLCTELAQFTTVCLAFCLIFSSVCSARAKKLETLMLGESRPRRYDGVGGWLISFWHLLLNTQLLCSTN